MRTAIRDIDVDQDHPPRSWLCADIQRRPGSETLPMRAVPQDGAANPRRWRSTLRSRTTPERQVTFRVAPPLEARRVGEDELQHWLRVVTEIDLVVC